jgi:hypothetical protein
LSGDIDPELLDIARASIGAEHELTSQQSARLRGQTAKELRDDARAMRGELGMEPLPDPRDRDRDEGGRFTAKQTTGSSGFMNRLIREASGRTG